MSTKLFRVEDEALQDARVRALSGDAFVLVLAPGKFRFFSTEEVLGFLSWTAVLGAGQERLTWIMGTMCRTAFMNSRQRAGA